jgi:hypothetical protein
MQYAVDGSNVLLYLNINGKPSVRAFAALLEHLLQKGHACQVFFDNSIRNHMRVRGVEADWVKLEDAIRTAGIPAIFTPHADPLIQAYCHKHGAALINGTDKMDSWKDRGPVPTMVHRARLFNRKKGVSLALMDDATGKFITQFALPDQVVFGRAAFAPNNGLEEAARVIAPSSHVVSTPTEGVLIIFALDASISMSWTHTHDQRPKFRHLNDIVRDCVHRLSLSALSNGTYIAFLRFSDDVSALPSPTGTEFAHVADWDARMDEFDYLDGMHMGLTNLRLAIQRSKELIQNAVADEQMLGDLADRWRALLILITDGRHEFKRSDGSLETDLDVAEEAMDIHLGISSMYGGGSPTEVQLIDDQISVGCVGIGTDVNRELLFNISSACTERQKQMARTAQIHSLLVGERLFIQVDSNNPRYADAIRSFVDVASSSA